jgi:hypothetical protein
MFDGAIPGHAVCNFHYFASFYKNFFEKPIIEDFSITLGSLYVIWSLLELLGD